MPRLEIRLTDSQMERLDALRGGEARGTYLKRMAGLAVEKASGNGVASEPRQGKGSPSLSRPAAPSPASSRQSAGLGEDDGAQSGRRPDEGAPAREPSRRPPEVPKGERLERARSVIEGDGTPLPAIAPRRWS